MSTKESSHHSIFFSSTFAFFGYFALVLSFFKNDIFLLNFELFFGSFAMVFDHFVSEFTSNCCSRDAEATANWPNCSISLVFSRKMPQTSSWVVRIDRNAFLTCFESTPFVTDFEPLMAAAADFFLTF